MKITKSQLREMIREAVLKEARPTISYKDWVPGDDDHHPGYCEDCGCELFSEPDPNDDPEDYQFRLDCESDHYPDYGYDGADHDASGRRYEQVKRTQGGRKLVQEQVSQPATAIDIAGISALLRQIEDKIYSYESQESDRVSRRKATESRSELRVWLRKLIYKMADA